jgi:hypothetical protein
VLGSADYAAANAFQDALALTRTAMNAKVLSVNWPSWRDTGMAAASVAPRVADTAGAASWDIELGPDDWLVAEHLVDERPTLPGTAYLDLLVRAVRERPGVDEFDVVVVEDLMLAAPLVVEEPVTVTVWLAERPGGGWAAEVESRVRGGAPVRHANATVSTPAEPDGTSEPITTTTTATEGEEPAGGPEFRVGPRFDNVRGVTEAGDGTLEIELELAAEFTAEVDRFAVHPALLDRALAARLSPGGHLAFSCRRVVVRGDLPAQVTARVRTVRRDRQRTVLDADLSDALGRRLLTVEGFTKLDRPEPLPQRRPATGRTARISADEGTTVLMRLLTASVPATVAVSPPRSCSRHRLPRWHRWHRASSRHR